MSYVHKCGKTIKDSAYHCNGCHDSFIGLTAFDAHRIYESKESEKRICFMDIASDPYEAGSKQFWADAEGYWHLGKKMTDEEKKAIWG
mgnify:CR=1 FL=1